MTFPRWNEPESVAEADRVVVSGLGVDYAGRRALDGVNLRVPAGEVFGLLGPNGAGKTTMFRVLATLLAPTRGEVRLCGENLAAAPQRIRSALAYMPDLAPMPSDLRAGEYLRFFAAAYGLSGKERDARVDECLETVGLHERRKDVCTRLSLGMRQRLALAKAILHRPKLLLLDEPASGLDPAARAELKRALRRQADAGSTVVLSSHVMAEIQDLCSSIGLLQRGRLIDAGPLREVLGRFGDGRPRVSIRAPRQRERVVAWLREVPGITVEPGFPDRDSVTILLEPGAMAVDELFSEIGRARLGVTGFRTVEPSVEEVVVRLGMDPSDA